MLVERSNFKAIWGVAKRLIAGTDKMEWDVISSVGVSLYRMKYCAWPQQVKKIKWVKMPV